MSGDKKTFEMQAYNDTHRENWVQDKKAGMEECRAVYMAEGSKGAAIWSGITAAGTWLSWKRRTCFFQHHTFSYSHKIARRRSSLTQGSFFDHQLHKCGQNISVLSI